MLFPSLLGSKNAQKKLSIKRFARVLNRKRLYRAMLSVASVF